MGNIFGGIIPERTCPGAFVWGTIIIGPVIQGAVIRKAIIRGAVALEPIIIISVHYKETKLFCLLCSCKKIAEK